MLELGSNQPMWFLTCSPEDVLNCKFQEFLVRVQVPVGLTLLSVDQAKTWGKQYGCARWFVLSLSF